MKKLLIVIALAGCGKASESSKSAEPINCARAGTLVSKRMGEFADKANIPADKRAQLDEAMATAIGMQCVLDLWDKTTLDCLGALGKSEHDLDVAAYRKGVDVCTKAIGPAKSKNLDTAVADAVAKVMKPAAAASAPAPAAPAPAAAKSPDARAFAFAHDLGYAAVMRVRGANVDERFRAAETGAKEYEVTLPPLSPLQGDMVKDSVSAMDYVLDKTGAPLVTAIEKRAGKRASLLFDIALKSEVLRLFYIGEKDKMTDRIADTIEEGSRLAKLPPALAKPLTDKVRSGAPADDVEAALDAWTAAVVAHVDSEPVAAATPVKATKAAKRQPKKAAAPVLGEDAM